MTLNPSCETTHRLDARMVFDSLASDNTEDKKRSKAYAHHLARACWYGARIVLRQTSPEAEGIFDFIIELHRACDGQWSQLRDAGIEQRDLDTWLEFAGMFLSNLGNYFNYGNRKVIPNVSKEVLFNMASISPEASAKLEEVLDLMMAPQPSRLGYPSNINQCGFYPDAEVITKAEIEAITKLMETKKIALENTRLRKVEHGAFEILQASAEKDTPRYLGEINIDEQHTAKVLLARGDHSSEMTKIYAELSEARKHANNEEQESALAQLNESFRTGNYGNFNSAHKSWVTDKAPKIEHCMGFLFGYRDPNGARADWLAVAGIAHPEETSKMKRLVEKSADIICTVPWAVPGENNGKGPFEPYEADVPDFAIIHVLASVSSTVWEAMNITIDDENGKRHGVKSLVFGNRMSLNSSPERPCYHVHHSEITSYMSCAHILRFIGTIIHEILGHGTGKLLTETAAGSFNFDHENKPINPVTGQPIKTWYKPGESWNSVFRNLAPTVEECRAFLVANYLVDSKDILALFGYDESSPPTADDLIYFAYIRIGIEGLRALGSFKVEDQSWSDDHAQAEFAILKHILQDGDGVIWIEHDPVAKDLFVRVDRSKIVSHGKPSIGRMLCKIHVWHCNADIDACRPFYEALTVVAGEYEIWRQIVASKPEPRWKFVQPNTFMKDDGTVELREYEASNVGIIQSFFERDV